MPRHSLASVPYASYMDQWSIEIVRQSGWDSWVWVCLAGSAVLICYALLSGIASNWRGRLTFGLIATGVGGTLLVVGFRPLHQPMVGLVWTFCLLSILSTVFYLNLREQLSSVRTASLLALRLVALFLLVPMLFEPVVRFVSHPKPQRQLIFLIDTSGSMSVPDVQNGPTRIQSVWQALGPQLEKIDEHFVPSFFTFDNGFRELKKTGDLATLTADGKSTDIVNGVNNALSHTTHDDSAVVLISDGIDNTSPSAPDALRASAHPIHTIRVGSDQAEPASIANIAVDSIDGPDDFVVNHDSTLKVTIASTALADRVVDVNMSEVDDADKPVGSIQVKKLVLQPTPAGPNSGIRIQANCHRGSQGRRLGRSRRRRTKPGRQSPGIPGSSRRSAHQGSLHRRPRPPRISRVEPCPGPRSKHRARNPSANPARSLHCLRISRWSNVLDDPIDGRSMG